MYKFDEMINKNSRKRTLFNDLDKFSKLKTQKETKKEKANVCNIASELYNDLPETYSAEYCDLSDA